MCLGTERKFDNLDRKYRMSKKLASIGSALTDIFVYSDEFSLQSAQEGVLLCSRYGEKIEVGEFHFMAGGGGCNTAVGFARLGFETTLYSELGHDQFAEHIVATLQAEGVSTAGVVREKREQTGVSIILLAPDGGRTVLVHRGAAAQLEEKDIDWSSFKPEWVHLSSVGGDTQLLTRLFAEMKEQQFGMSWTPGKSEISMVTATNFDLTSFTPTLLVLNKEEWAALVSVQSHFDQHSQFVVVTDGRNGGQVRQQGGIVHEYTIEDKPVIDETGAGDAFAVGFVTAYLSGKNVPDSCETAKANAASVVQQFGAQAGLLRTSA